MTQKISDLHGDPSPKAARLLEATDDIIKQAMSANPNSKIRRYPKKPRFWLSNFPGFNYFYNLTYLNRNKIY